jgi:N-acetyl-gamma-glutamylphosphate reductase
MRPCQCLHVSGISGYIGGQIGAILLSYHPECEITSLVRQEYQVHTIKARFPEVRLVKGNLDSHEVLLREAQDADMVIRTSLQLPQNCQELF